MAVLMKTEVFVTVIRLIYSFSWRNIPEDLSLHMLYKPLFKLFVEKTSLCCHQYYNLANNKTFCTAINNRPRGGQPVLPATIHSYKQSVCILINITANRQLICTVINIISD